MKNSKASIKTTAMTTLLQQAQQNEDAVTDAHAAHILAVKNRREAFAGIPRLAARMVRVVSASETSKEVVEAAKVLKRKLVAQPNKAKDQPGQPEAERIVAEAETHVSSRLDFNSKMETFATLIAVVQRITAYNPNEADLKVTALKAVLADLRAKSDAVMKTLNTYNKLREAHNKILYGTGGVSETANAAKDYIRGVYGVRSGIARQVSQARIVN
jgi:hypothetical protein